MSGMQNFVDIPSSGEAVDNEDVVVDDSEGGVVLLQANPHRKGALIINTGQGDMRVTTDGTDPSPTRGKLVPAGAVLTLEAPYCPIVEVKAIRQNDTNTTANASEVQ